MKTILAYGDSLTYGADPAVKGGRHAYEDRWPSVLEAGLAGKARVIAEGLGGRTTAFDDHHAAFDFNGARILPTILQSHAPLDLVVFMLGTNDLKTFVCGSAFGATVGMRRLVEIVRHHPYRKGAAIPRVVIVSPPLAVKAAGEGEIPSIAPRADESKLFAHYYSRLAQELDCGFFDAAGVTTPSPIDGVHLDPANTRAIGHGLVPLVKSILSI
jgi:lysophospholipase L1-like esterase